MMHDFLLVEWVTSSIRELVTAMTCVQLLYPEGYWVMSVIVMVHRHLYVWRISWKILTTQKMASHDLSWISVRLSMFLEEGGIARSEGKFPVRYLCVFIHQPTCIIDIIMLIIIV